MAVSVQTAATPEAPIAAKRTQVLTGADRCDQCGARAWHRAYLPDGRALHFCHHHAQVHRPVLEPKALDWLDESWAINPPKEFYN